MIDRSEQGIDRSLHLKVILEVGEVGFGSPDLNIL